MIIPKRAWWKFWPVVCWQHLRVVPENNVCGKCALEGKALRTRPLVVITLPDGMTELADEVRTRLEKDLADVGHSLLIVPNGTPVRVFREGGVYHRERYENYELEMWCAREADVEARYRLVEKLNESKTPPLENPSSSLPTAAYVGPWTQPGATVSVTDQVPSNG